MSEQEIKNKIESRLMGINSTEGLASYFLRKKDIYLLEKEIFTCYCAKFQFPHFPIIDSYVEGEVVIEYEEGQMVDIDLEIPFNLKTNLDLDTYIEILEEVHSFLDRQYQMDRTSQRILVDYKEGKRHGVYKYYDSDDNLIQIGAYEHGVSIGVWKTYYPSGQLFKENNFDGIGAQKYLETKWFEDGERAQEWRILPESEDIQIQVYNKEGSVQSKSIYTKNSELKKVWSYYKGNAKTFGDYSIKEYKGQFNYTWTFFKNEQVIKTIEFGCNSQRSRYIEYDGNGQINREIVRIDGKEVLNYYKDENS